MDLLVINNYVLYKSWILWKDYLIGF
jgi:hypothetical protein